MNCVEGDGQHPQHVINVYLAGRRNIILFPFKCNVAPNDTTYGEDQKLIWMCEPYQYQH